MFHKRPIADPTVALDELQFEGEVGEVRALRSKEITSIEPQLYQSITSGYIIASKSPRELLIFTYSGSKALVDVSGNAIIKQNSCILVF